MSYITRHVKRDGTVDTSVHKDGGVVMATTHELGKESSTIEVSGGKLGKKIEVEYNFSRVDNGGKFLPAAARKKQIREHLVAEKEANANRPKGTMAKTHSIFPELYWKIRAEQGLAAVRDKDYMKKVASEHGCKL